MKWTTKQAVRGVAFAMLSFACAAGCSRVSSDQRDARDRHLRRAFSAKDSQDINGAIGWCEKALARDPDLALAHRELALMLDNYRQDYVGALYHYQRYLQLRPDAENRAAVEELIRYCRLSFAAQVTETPDEIRRGLQARDERIQKLELELATLRGAVPPPAKPTDAAPAAGAAAAAPQGQVHVVQGGENLATISERYYGTRARWKSIFDANRDRLNDANNLRVGTTLTIPPVSTQEP